MTEDLTQTQPEGKPTLQAALAMSGSQSHLVSQRNIVVEGADGYMLITELSNLLLRSGGPGLPEESFREEIFDGELPPDRADRLAEIQDLCTGPDLVGICIVRAPQQSARD